MIHDRNIIVTDAIPAIQKLTEIRLAWQMKSKDVAQRIGCAHRTFMDWEAGHRDPSLKALIRWAKILGYDLSLSLQERS